MKERIKAIVPVALAGVVVVGCSVAVSVAFRGLGRYSDEVHHLRQISRFCAGDLSLDRKLTTIPGFHALMALAGRAMDDCSLRALRDCNVVIGWLGVIAFFATARIAGGSLPWRRTLHFYFLPILLPYHFLVYTDVASLACVLATVALFLSGRRLAAGIAGAASVLLRQTNVVWLLFLGAHAFAEKRERKAYLPLLPGFVIFAVFVAVNGSLAMGDQRAHRPGFHTGNLFFTLFLFFLLFLPRNLAVLWSQRARLTDLRCLGLLAVVSVVFFLTFGLDHAYNRFPGFLRNELLLALEERPWLKVAFLLPVIGAVAVLWMNRLRRAVALPLLGATLLSLLPTKLIEHRYSLVPLALWLVFREEDSGWIETLGLVQSVVISAVLLYGIARGAFAL